MSVPVLSRDVHSLTGPELALWVARAQGHEQAFVWTAPSGKVAVYRHEMEREPFMPHEVWNDAGQLIYWQIERLERDVDGYSTAEEPWYAEADQAWSTGHTPLVAVCRAIVRKKYGLQVPATP